MWRHRLKLSGAVKVVSFPPSMARPEHYPYSFKALLDVPRRLFHPPPAQVKIGRVRSMSLTPLFEVKLRDVLGTYIANTHFTSLHDCRWTAPASPEQKRL